MFEEQKQCVAPWLEKNGTDAPETACLGNADGLSQVERVINTDVASALTNTKC